jgi:hypothetical protein
MHFKNKLLKIITVNILVFLGTLIFINLAVISIYQISNLNIFPDYDKRKGTRLPNYKNVDWARVHFKELYEIDHGLHREYISYIGWRGMPYNGQTVNIDEKGIRFTPQSPLSNETSPLVVFLGGSAMWGWGVNDENTIPALFAKISQGRYRTINFSDIGYNAFQSYLFLKFQIINGLKPKIVVSFDGVNDALTVFTGSRPFSHLAENRISKAVKKLQKEEETVLTFSHFFLEPLKYFISQHKSKKSDSEGYQYMPHDRIESAAKALLESWLSTKDLAEKNGVVFIGILQPNAAMGTPYLEHLKLSDISFFEIYYKAVLKLLKTPKYNKLSNNIIVLTNIFDIKEPIYIDGCHVSPNGNQIIAENIYNYISTFIDK